MAGLVALIKYFLRVDSAQRHRVNPSFRFRVDIALIAAFFLRLNPPPLPLSSVFRFHTRARYFNGTWPIIPSELVHSVPRGPTRRRSVWYTTDPTRILSLTYYSDGGFSCFPIVSLELPPTGSISECDHTVPNTYSHPLDCVKTAQVPRTTFHALTQTDEPRNPVWITIDIVHDRGPRGRRGPGRMNAKPKARGLGRTDQVRANFSVCRPCH